jgi:hypothetical protein
VSSHDTRGDDVKGIVFGVAVGYVLGARAGRGRYDQIVRTYRALADHPAVQGAAGIARAKIGERTGFGNRSHSSQTNGQRRTPEPSIPRTN